MARLMTGDVAGADSIAKQGSGELASSAEWLWVSGRRKEAYTKLAAQAPGLANRDLQARAYAHLAVWALLLNDRTPRPRRWRKRPHPWARSRWQERWPRCAS